MEIIKLLSGFILASLLLIVIVRLLALPRTERSQKILAFGILIVVGGLCYYYYLL